MLQQHSEIDENVKVDISHGITFPQRAKSRCYNFFTCGMDPELKLSILQARFDSLQNSSSEIIKIKSLI